MSTVATLLMTLALALFPAHPGDENEDWTVEESSTKTYAYDVPAGGALSVEVDTYAGSIHVRAAETARVEATVRQTVRAVTPARAVQARREVTLEAGQQGSQVRFYVDGPFRCERDCGDCGDSEDGCGFRHSHWDDDDYEVAYDFELTVPARVDLELRTVNRGDVAVEGTQGAFLVRNVNGEIRLERVSGSGSARTVNGGVRVELTQAPRDGWKISTINGDVELRLPASAGIEARVHTMNGEAWSDFAYTLLPPDAVARQERDGRRVYRSEGSRLRLGPGGPLVAMDTLNGDVLIRKNPR
jgi:putative adhesin